VRFRVCDDSTARLNVTERDSKPGVNLVHTPLPRRGEAVRSVFAAMVIPARFRHGRYTVTLQARDRQGATSQPHRRTLTHS